MVPATHLRLYHLLYFIFYQLVQQVLTLWKLPWCRSMHGSDRQLSSGHPYLELLPYQCNKPPTIEIYTSN